MVGNLDTFDGLFKIGKSSVFCTAANSYLTNPENKEYWDFFNTRQYRIDPKTISSQIMNLWQKESLLPENCQDKEQEWRDFTLMDIVWIAIVKQLRSIGIDFSIIKRAKERLNVRTNSCEYYELEFYAALSYFNKTPCEILIFFDGSAEVGTIDEINDSKEKSGMIAHVSLSLNVVLQNIFRDKDLRPIYNSWVDLDEKETKLLEKIKSGKFDNLSLTLKDGVVCKLEGEKAYNGNAQLHDIQREYENQDYEVKQRGGKIRHIKQTIKL